MTINNSALDVFRIFRLVGTSEELLRAPDICKRLDTTFSVTRRGLATLVETGFLERHQHWGCYEMGFAARQIATTLLARFPIRRFALPTLGKLAFQVHGTASLNVRVGWYGVPIASMEGGGSLFTHSLKLGDPNLLSANGAGRAIIAFLGEAEVRRYRQFLKRHPTAGNTPAARRRVQSHLEEIRASGWCQDKNPEQGAIVVSVPLRGPAGTPIASISVEKASASVVGQGHEILVKALLEAVRYLQEKATATPEMLVGPFDHLDPDEIRFGLD